MSKALIISDNDILNQLYATNLEVYLNTKVRVVQTTDKAFESLKKIPFDLVVSTNFLDGKDISLDVFNFIKNEKLDAKLIIIGSISHPVMEKEVKTIPSSYHLQNLLKMCADILGVTAKQMAELAVPKFYGVDIHFLKTIKEAPCSIYLQMKDPETREDKYTLAAKKGDLSSEILNKMAAEGIQKLYVNSLDRLLVINSISNVLCDILKNTSVLPIEKKHEALKTSFEFAVASFSQMPEAAQEIMNIAVACSKVMEEMVTETPSLKALLSLLHNNRDGFIYTHSMLAAFVSDHMIRNVSWGGETHIEKINFVLFFHDIILAPIYLKYPHLKFEEDLLFSSELTDQEKETVLNHARLAAETIVSYKRLPIGSDLLIKQHHGMTSGIGFAMEFKDDISPLSKIVLVAEAFIDEFLKEKEANKDFQVDIDKMILTLNEKFKKSTYKKIVETLKTLKM